MQCNTDSCCEHIAVGNNIYLYVCVSIYWPLCVLCVFVCLYVMSDQGTRTMSCVRPQ